MNDNTRFDWNHRDAAAWRETHQITPRKSERWEKISLVILVALALIIYASLWLWPF